VDSWNTNVRVSTKPGELHTVTEPGANTAYVDARIRALTDTLLRRVGAMENANATSFQSVSQSSGSGSGSVAASSITGTISNAISSALATIADLTATNIVATNATTTNLYVSATSMTAGLRVSSLDCSSLGNGGTLTTDASGNVVCAADDGGGGTTFGKTWEIASSALTPTTTVGLLVSASSTFNGGLSIDRATTTNATSTNLFATLGRFTSGIIDTLIATAATITNLTSTTITATNATTTRVDALDYVAVGRSATTTIRGDGVASTIPFASSTALTVSGTASTSNLIVSNAFTFASLSGFLKATAGVISTALVDLASNVTGILAVANGGTGWGNIASGAVVLGNGTGSLATTSAGTNGQVLALFGGVPTWVATTTLSTISGTLGVASGGTGLTSTPSFGQILRGTGSGYALVATSTLGIALSDTTGTLSGTQLDGVFSSNGILARTTTGTYASRTLTGTSNQITVANGDGVSGNPTLSLPSLVIFTNASSTLFSNVGTTYFGGTATATISTAGVLTLPSALTVSSGGTGQTTLTGIVKGAGTSALSAITTSAGIAAELSDETGSGALVFGTSPSLASPTFSGLSSFTQASSTQQSILDGIFVGRSATTTIRGDGIASTLPYASTTMITATTASTTNLIVSSTGGVGTRCLQVGADGTVSANASACGSGASIGEAWAIGGNGFTGFLAPTTTQKLWLGQASSTLLSVMSTAYFGGSATTTFTASGNALHPASGYINFGTTEGTSGYGFRDNSGTLEFKNSGGSWQGVTTATSGPTFSVHKNGTNQTVTASTFTKITWDTEVFDTNNNFDSTTNERFTPTVPGKYIVTLNVECEAVPNQGTCISDIYKNGGSMSLTRTQNGTGATNDMETVATAVLDMNGTTDYLEGYAFTSGTVVGGGSDRTLFTGALIAPVNATAGGWQNDGTQSFLADSTDKVGIGTTTPWAKLSVDAPAGVNSFAIGSSTATYFLVNSSGNVGIGTTTPGANLVIGTTTNLKFGTDFTGAVFGGGARPAFSLADGTGTLYGQVAGGIGYLGTLSNHALFLQTNGTNRMTIDTSGNVGIGTTNPSTFPNPGVAFNPITNNTGLIMIGGNSSMCNGCSMVLFSKNGSAIADISHNTGTGGVNYNTTSDRRVKENIATTTLGLDALMRLPVRDFNLIDDPIHQKQTGFIAQELFVVFPYAVTTRGDNGLDPLGASSTPWGVDYGRITPLLAKSIQELNLKLEDLATTTQEFEEGSFTSRFFASLFARLTQWFADAANGIEDFFARVGNFGRVNTDELCTTKSDGSEVCASGDQLAAILSASAAASTPTAGGTPSSGDAPGAPAGLSAPEAPDADTTTDTPTAAISSTPQASNDNAPASDLGEVIDTLLVEDPPTEPAEDPAPAEPASPASNDNTTVEDFPATATE